MAQTGCMRLKFALLACLALTPVGSSAANMSEAEKLHQLPIGLGVSHPSLFALTNPAGYPYGAKIRMTTGFLSEDYDDPLVIGEGYSRSELHLGAVFSNEKTLAGAAGVLYSSLSTETPLGLDTTYYGGFYGIGYHIKAIKLSIGAGGSSLVNSDNEYLVTTNLSTMNLGFLFNPTGAWRIGLVFDDLASVDLDSFSLGVSADVSKMFSVALDARLVDFAATDLVPGVMFNAWPFVATLHYSLNLEDEDDGFAFTTEPGNELGFNVFFGASNKFGILGGYAQDEVNTRVNVALRWTP